MTRRRASKPKVAFVVEGRTGQAVVETLAKRLAAVQGQEVQLASITLDGSPRVRNMFPELHFLREKGYQPIVVVFDTDGDGTMVDALRARLIEEGLEEIVKLVPVDPSIEAWLSTEAKRPRKTPGEYAEAIQRVPLYSLRKNKTFRLFESSLKEALKAA